MPAEALVTAEELLLLPGSKWLELVRGHLVQVNPAGAHHGRVAAEIAAALIAFVRPRRLGTVMVEAGFVLERDPDTVRGPDVSFARAGHPGVDRRGFADGAPHLAVEVVSRDNSMRQLLAKADEYLAAGTELVWIIDPEAGTARVLDDTVP